MIIASEKINNINTTFIKTDKFKTIVIKVFFKGKFDYETATHRSLLARVLSTSTAKYPNKKELVNKLYDLYDANFSISCSPTYENSIISFNLEFVNDKYLPNDSIIKDALKFLHEAIFNPNVVKNEFNVKNFLEEKRLLKSTIENIYNNKNRYALRRLLDHMCKDEPSSINPLGDLTILEQLTAKDLYNTYQQMLENDEVAVYCLGEFEIDKMKEYLHNYLKLSKLPSPKVEYQLYFTEEKRNLSVNEIHEEQDINQTKLLMGFRTNIYPVDKLLPALIVFNTMYGGLFVSDLFKVIREQHSLAYQIASQTITEAGLLIVSAGIEKANINQTTSLVINEFRKYQEGFVDEELFTIAKNNLLNDLKELEDNPHALIVFIHRRNLLNLSPDIDAYINEINNVTTNDIIGVARRIELDTIYTLSNKVGGQHEG